MKSDEDLRRLKRVEILDEHLPKYISSPRYVEKGLPEDARLTNLYRREARSAWEGVFHSSEFDIVPEAATIPTAENVISRFEDSHAIMSYGNRRENMGRKILSLSNEVFSMLFREGYSVKHDLPYDTRFLDMWDVPRTQRVEIGLGSTEFEQTEAGEVGDVVADHEWCVEKQPEQPSVQQLSAYINQ